MPRNAGSARLYLQLVNIIDFFIAAKIGKSLKALKFCQFMCFLRDSVHIFSTGFCGKINFDKL